MRRSEYVVTYWERGTHTIYHCARRTTCAADVRATAILDVASEWTTREDVRRAVPYWSGAEIDATVDALVACGALEAADVPPHPEERVMRDWGGWSPVAAFFHGATRGMPAGTPGASELRNRRVLVDREYPPPTKEYPGRGRIELPVDIADGSVAAVLRERRSWREFGARSLTLREVSTLLGLTFGVQRWMHIGGDRWVALKTSPSGGARHSIEAYLLAFDVEGLACATYHYDPDRHALAPLDAPTSQALLRDFVPHQPGFHDCPAFIVMTSVFARVQWKYNFPRAYRVVLLDAGHLGQTFALVATSLGLAPFCTAAIDDPRIEQHLGIDGVSEAVLFAVGVGPRPEAKPWTPNHDRTSDAETVLPAWSARLPAVDRS